MCDIVGKEKISIATFENKRCEKTELEKITLHLKASTELFEIEALCTPFICLPIKNQFTGFAKEKFEHLKDLELADKNQVEVIDLLIGSDYYWPLMTGRVKCGKPGEPVGIETKLGWVFNGPIQDKECPSAHVNFASELSSHALFVNSKSEPESSELEQNLNRFWDLITLGISENEKHNQDKFIDSIYRNSEGRYETKLP